MKRIAFAVAALSIAVLARAEDAATVYQSKCALCHGKDGKGSPVGMRMGAKDLAMAKAMSEAEIQSVITKGKPGTKMMGFAGKLTDAQIADLAKLVKAGVK